MYADPFADWEDSPAGSESGSSAKSHEQRMGKLGEKMIISTCALSLLMKTQEAILCNIILELM